MSRPLLQLIGFQSGCLVLLHCRSSVHGLAAHKQDGEVGLALTIYNTHEASEWKTQNFNDSFTFGSLEFAIVGRSLTANLPFCRHGGE